jgi:hypothetical protein
MIHARYSLALAALSLIASAALAAPNLPVVCPTPAEAGKPVATSCGGAAQTGQQYRTPAPTDLVRVDPARTAGQGADWSASNTGFRWKARSALAPGELVEVCTTDIPEGSLVSGSACQGWAFQAITSATVPIGGGRANLKWTAPVPVAGSDVTGYRLYKGKDGATPTKLIDLAGPVFEYADAGLTAGTYTYQVTALAGALESPRSPSVSGSISAPARAPGAPQNLSVTITVTVP